MKIESEVIEGPYKGKVFTINSSEPDRILVGRDGEGCQAHLRLERGKDMYISRNHFLLEIRPPNCFIMDSTSKNKTYLKRRDSDKFEEISRGQLYPLYDGDWIRLGPYTIMAVKITVEEKEKRKTIDLGCTICGRSFLEVDLYPVCPECRKKESEKLINREYEISLCEKRKKREEEAIYVCIECGKDVTFKANSDGRAKELAEVCSYLCEKCVDKHKETLTSGGPKKVKHYLVLKELGRGGMGVVYKVWDESTYRVLALKMILQKYLKEERAKKLFQREMNITSALVHPNIVRYIGGTFTEETACFVMEYVKGKSADHLLKDYPKGLPIELACDIICQVLDGLEFAHSKKFVHRDLKPQNILLKRKEGKFIAKISDFGLAKSMDEAGGTILAGQPFAGTLLFMSPQQIINYKSPEPHYDTYSVGVTLYVLLTGCFPFDIPGPLTIIRRMVEGKDTVIKNPIEIVLYESPIPLRERASHIPEKLAKVVDKSIKKKPYERYLTAREFKEDILKAIRP